MKLEISAYDNEAERACRTRWSSIAKPLGGLGELEGILAHIAGLTGEVRYSIEKRAVVVFCADNGVVANGVTQTGKEVTATVARNLTTGMTSVCAMGRRANCDVIGVDMGVDWPEIPDRLLNRSVRPGTSDIAVGPAMSRREAEQAVQAGIDLAGELKEKGYRILAQGEMGIGNTTIASAVASMLLRCDPAVVTGRGAGLDDKRLAHKIAVIRQAIEVNRPDPEDPMDILAKVGGFDIAGLMGLCLGGAVHKIPVVLDGVISNAAAVLACRLYPAARSALIAGHLSREPAAALLLKELGLVPLVHAGMHLGEGTGAVAALPLLDMAYGVYDDMPTFDEIAIESYQPL